ncbi:MAG TPA: peptide-methionine (R)-S-oxide reductase MsrB [Pyrinomonadaceae bacterium]|nr:peptide-methionine (R)-S-oxide reductase MsrB [Pyrinomonadaceae bacterium]
MNSRALILKLTVCCAAALLVLAPLASARQDAPVKKVVKSEDEWRRLLTPEQFEVLRRKGTEAPYSSPLNKEHGRGTFVCAACGQAVFSSRAKYDSGTGWPSFWQPVSKRAVHEEVDNSLSEARTEVLCSRCGSHLGHVFDDGPDPTGLRYCMNGLALRFIPRR